MAAAAPPAAGPVDRGLGVSRVQYAVDVLHGIGAPITAGNVAAILIWITHESGGTTGFAFNPLNSTDHPYGSAGQGGSQGNIQRYQNYQQGVATIVHQLQYPNHGYPAIVNAFRSDAGSGAVLAAVKASDWGTKNFSSAELGGHATVDPGGTTAQPVAYIPGTHIHIPSSPAGGGIVPGPVKGIFGAIGDVTDAAGAMAELAGRVVNLFLNWHYLAEVVIGSAMVLIGIRLVIADTTGAKVVPRPNPAAVAAVGAAVA